MTSLIARALLAAMMVCAAQVAQSQGELELPLRVNPEQIKHSEQESRWQTAQGRGGETVLTLPFFDDFSRYSLPTDDPSIPDEWQRWCDTSAYLNNTFPIQPPTIGVATLDGLRGNGYPWDWTSEDAYGPADTLTSLPIDLTGFNSEDDVYISFYYQSGGRGNDADQEDLLILEAYVDLAPGTWVELWSSEGIPQAPFEQVYVSLDSTDFGNAIYQDGFQFRFRNYGHLSGAFDHWHIDYVQVRAGVNPEDDVPEELAYMYPGQTLLRNYTAMPWDHFKEDPEFFMDPDTVQTYQRNLGETVNFASGYRVEGPDQEWDFPNVFSNTFGNEFSIIRTELSVQGATDLSPDNNFTYSTLEPEETDTCATFKVQYYHDNTDNTPQNDTATFYQVFQNYYAYDDGSAERAYAINQSGGKIAMRFQVEKQDTLLGLFIHFLPHGDFNQNENFLLKAWTDNAGEPGDEIGENFTFYTPEYHFTGPNVFTYYAYDEPQVVEGTIYVGFLQDTDVFLNIGNDKGGLNKNTENLYFQLGIGSGWTASSITGSLMIRPVFSSGKSGVIWNDISDVEASVNVYPNPARDLLTVDAGLYGLHQVAIYDMTGRLLMDTASQSRAVLDIQHLPQGMYSVVMTNDAGLVARAVFVKE